MIVPRLDQIQGSGVEGEKQKSSVGRREGGGGQGWPMWLQV